MRDPAVSTQLDRQTDADKARAIFIWIQLPESFCIFNLQSSGSRLRKVALNAIYHLEIYK